MMNTDATHILSECALGIRHAPDSADAWFNLGKALNDLKRYAEAVHAYQRATELNPGDPFIWYNLGNLLKREDRAGEAITAYRQGITCDDTIPQLHMNLGLALVSLGRHDEAIVAYREAIRLDTACAQAYNNLGEVLNRCGRPDEALDAYTRAQELCPDNADTAYNLGTHLALRDDPAGAELYLSRALRLRPEFVEAWVNLAGVMQDGGRTDEAISLLRNAITCRPGFAEAHYNLALVLLQSGMYEEGWREYAWRHATGAGHVAPVHDGVRPWDGSFREGMTLLIKEEQGYGDTVQSARFLKLLTARGIRVILECRNELHPLFYESRIPLTLVSPGEKLSGIDAVTTMFSLPLFFGTTLATIPSQVPYLHSSIAGADRWRSRVRSQPARMHIGIVWSGNPEHRNDRHRSVPPEALLPLLRTPGVLWHTLQPELRGSVSGLFPSDIPMHHHGEALTDFGESAALVEQLDLVITVDTVAAHLGGALAKPVWVLLPFNPDWRWMKDRTDSPWYPTLRLFRQLRPREWAPVVEMARDALNTLIKGKPGMDGTA